MNSIPERVAVLEANAETAADAVADITSTLKDIDKKVSDINLRLAKSMSFLGGMAFTFSLFGGVFVVAIKYILGRMGVDI